MVSLVTEHRWIRRAAFTITLAIAAGCGSGENRPRATQVVAKVNADEITVHQIDAVLAQSPNLTPETAAAAKREILNRLIDQQIAVQQALRKKLDRSPNVLGAVEAVRAETLARAYAEQIARAQPKPSPGEVKKYYTEHPELFGQRRVFALETISVAAAEELGPELKDRIARSASMKAIAEWLRSRNAGFAENKGTRGAEEIPLQMLARLHAMKDGEIQVFDEGGGRFEVIRVTAATPAPVDEATAAPRIQQFLFNRDLNEAMGREMRRLKAAAKIEYLGEFADDAAAAKSTAKGKVADTEPVAPENDSSKRSQLLQQNIEKGVRGLR
jgi:EpsD family peptidyl-prolyl cis-trans isomerase